MQSKCSYAEKQIIFIPNELTEWSEISPKWIKLILSTNFHQNRLLHPTNTHMNYSWLIIIISLSMCVVCVVCACFIFHINIVITLQPHPYTSQQFASECLPSTQQKYTSHNNVQLSDWISLPNHIVTIVYEIHPVHIRNTLIPPLAIQFCNCYYFLCPHAQRFSSNNESGKFFVATVNAINLLPSRKEKQKHICKFEIEASQCAGLCVRPLVCDFRISSSLTVAHDCPRGRMRLHLSEPFSIV